MSVFLRNPNNNSVVIESLYSSNRWDGNAFKSRMTQRNPCQRRGINPDELKSRSVVGEVVNHWLTPGNDVWSILHF